MKPAEKIAFFADKLRDISATGLMFSNNFYEREAYHKVQDIAMQMLALAVDEKLEYLEPLIAPIFNRLSPLVVGDAAVINHAGEILLIQRQDNKKWAMPGGAIEVGETVAEGVEREALEETGFRCKAVRLVGVFDSRYCGTVSRHHLVQFVFLCKLLDEEPVSPTHAHEILDLGWFSEERLPESLDPGHRTRIPYAFRGWYGEADCLFDNLKHQE